MDYKKKEYNSKTLRDYATDFMKYDTICTQSAMGSGKTKNLIKLLDEMYKNRKITIVSFRRSLLREYRNMLPGFKYYTDIKDKKIDLDAHKKRLIQADSLYRISGEVDMLVMDECTFTFEHIVTYVKKFKSQCVSALEHLLSTSTKVLAIDALLNEDYRNLTYPGKTFNRDISD
ncbi:origin of replication binding protein-domain-containing protein [Mucor mucedo]|uniref:origin of replication binding protein-domain-containing protein n=1 Tax=Mucor mucedo TaxID=29922 RepID=UPI0022207245|nr:origin of replication binding protein-domain-containing protein [Mucor mucedo]KAI7889659.1 origin of replication binding protein-domain-containing protein [Mucor mucedo]